MYTPWAYLDVDIEWGSLKIGKVWFSWFNSDTRGENWWGSFSITLDFKWNFLFFYHELKKRPAFEFRCIDPEISEALKGE